MIESIPMKARMNGLKIRLHMEFCFEILKEGRELTILMRHLGELGGD